MLPILDFALFINYNYLLFCLRSILVFTAFVSSFIYISPNLSATPWLLTRARLAIYNGAQLAPSSYLIWQESSSWLGFESHRFGQNNKCPLWSSS